MSNPRKTALKLLTRSERDGGYSNILLDSELKASELSDADRALTARLFFGVISRKLTLDYYISKLSRVAGSKIEPQVRNVLRLGLYQLIYLDRIPPHAAINESVALVSQRSKGFVNALLREYTRSGSKIVWPQDRAERLSVSESVPIELCRKLIGEYGFDKAEEIVRAYNFDVPLSVRVNTQKTSREELLKLFSERGIEANVSELSPDGITVNATINQLPGFDEGLFFIQDGASQLCCAALGVKAGDTFIDCCSAPGSKSFGAAMYMENRGRIFSFDLHENKLTLIKKSAERLGIDIIKTKAVDARLPIFELIGKADSVLCDVPCSGYGVVAKKPEIRYKPLSDAAGLPEIQYSILESCAGYVKPGGILVYSTCTVLSEENCKLAERFAASHPEFEQEGFTHNGIDYPAVLQLFPNDRHDGFFIARFRKKRD